MWMLAWFQRSSRSCEHDLQGFKTPPHSVFIPTHTAAVALNSTIDSTWTLTSLKSKTDTRSFCCVQTAYGLKGRHLLWLRSSIWLTLVTTFLLLAQVALCNKPTVTRCLTCNLAAGVWHAVHVLYVWHWWKMIPAWGAWGASKVPVGGVILIFLQTSHLFV